MFNFITFLKGFDTSNNINSTEITTFNATDIKTPNVTTLIPTTNSIYNVDSTIQIAATILDNVKVQTVLANITYPNGTKTSLTLTNSSAFPNKYNNTFTIPGIIGSYNIIF